MNSLSARLRALAVTLLAFGLGTLALAGLVIGLDRLPVLAQALPGPIASLADWPPLALNAGPFVFLVAAFVLVGAAVLALNSRYLDRMFEIFADVLLMILVAKAAIALAATGLLFGLGSASALPLSEAMPLLALMAIVSVVLWLVPYRARGVLVLRLLVVLLLLGAAPLVIATPFLA